MAAGILRIHSYAARRSAPMADVSVTVTGEGFTASRVTGEDGLAADIEIEAPACSLSLDENNTTEQPYAVCDLVAESPATAPSASRACRSFPARPPWPTWK